MITNAPRVYVMDVHCEECGAQAQQECVKWKNGAWLPLSRCILPTGRPTTYHRVRSLLARTINHTLAMPVRATA